MITHKELSKIICPHQRQKGNMSIIGVLGVFRTYDASILTTCIYARPVGSASSLPKVSIKAHRSSPQ